MKVLLLSLLLTGQIHNTDLQTSADRLSASMKAYDECTWVTDTFQIMIKTKPQFRKRVWLRFKREHLWLGRKYLKDVKIMIDSSGFLL